MSSEAIIFPAPNRGNTRTASQSSSGIFAYASKGHIYFIDLNKNPPVYLDSKSLYCAHKGRITVLSFSKCEGDEKLASCSENGELKVWNLENGTSINVDVKDFRALEWIHGDPDLLVYISEKKFLVKWNLKWNKSAKIKTASDVYISRIVSNELDPQLIAVGHDNGIISIININKESLLYKLKAHSSEIVDLAWNLDCSPDTLLSFSLDTSIRVWKLGENSPVYSYYSTHKGGNNDERKVQKMMGFFHPTNKDIIICSNIRGEIGEIDMEKKPVFKPYLMKSQEMKLKYLIAVILSKDKTHIFCFDSFKISKFDINKKECVTCFPCLLGFVYDLSISRINANLMAISCGDGNIRISDKGLQEDGLKVNSIYIQYKSKIITAAWHPRLESILAYGTDEGRVGIVDVHKRRNQNCFETHHKETVYALTWGPCVAFNYKKGEEYSLEAKEKMFLYSCGSGIIYVNEEGNYKTKAKNFKEITVLPLEDINSNNVYSEMCWNSNFTTFCAGTYLGTADIFDGNLKYIGRLTTPSKQLECLRWHPDSTYMSPNGSPLNLWLACSGNETNVYIYDVKELSENDPIHRPNKLLPGNKARVVSISWSEHSDGYLVSASRDSSVMVWNVLDQTLIATFFYHYDAVFSVQWSPLNKDIIYSGGQDSTVRSWKISEQSVKPHPDRARTRRLKKPKKPVKEELPEDDTKEESSLTCLVDENTKSDASTGETKEIPLPIKKESTESDLIPEFHTEKEVRPKANELNRLFVVHVKRPTLFPALSYITSESIDEDDMRTCMRLAEIVSEKQKLSNVNDTFESLKKSSITDEEALKFGLYTDQSTALRMADVQSKKFKEEGESIPACELALLSGNIQPVLIDAAEKRNLTPFLVSMAPSVSYGFWLEMCEKYAIQLTEMQRYYMAISYYMICGKVHEAINLLAEKVNTIEAFALAKARLPEKDPLIFKLFCNLQAKFVKSKNFVAEALGAIGSNDPIRAAKILAYSTSPIATRTAAYICRKFCLDKEADKYLFQCLEKCLIHHDKQAFQSVVLQEPSFQVYESLMCVQEILSANFHSLKNRDDIPLTTILNPNKSGPKITAWSGVAAKDSEQCLIYHLYSILSSSGLLSGEKFSLIEIYEALKILECKRIDSSSQTHVLPAIYLTKYIVLSLMDDASANQALLKVFETTYNFKYVPRAICLLLFPINFYWNEITGNFNYETLPLQDIEKKNGLSSYKTFYTAIADIVKTTTCLELPLFNEEDLRCNLSNTAIKIKTILTSKTTEELIMLYFVASMVVSLKKRVEKGEAIKLLLERNCSEVVVVNINDIDIGVAVIKESENILNEKSNCEEIVTIPEELLSVGCEDENKGSVGADILRDGTKNDLNEDFLDVINKENNVPNCDILLENVNEVEFNCVSDKGKLKCDISTIRKSNRFIESEDDINKEKPTDNVVEELLDDVNAKVCINVESEVLINNDRTQLRELIKSVIEEANNRAQAIMENKEKSTSESIKQDTEENEIMSNVTDISCSLETNKTGNYLSLDTRDFEEIGIIEESKETVDCAVNHSQSESPFNHEPCLKRMDLIFNLLSFILFNVCKDEFALLYYVKEHLNALNNSLSSTVLNQISKKITKESHAIPVKEKTGKVKEDIAPEVVSDIEISEVVKDVNSSSESPNILAITNVNESENLDSETLNWLGKELLANSDVHSGVVTDKLNLSDSSNIHTNSTHSCIKNVSKCEILSGNNEHPEMEEFSNANSHLKIVDCSETFQIDTNKTETEHQKICSEPLPTVNPKEDVLCVSSGDSIYCKGIKNLDYDDHNYSACNHSISEIAVSEVPPNTESLQQEHRMISEILNSFVENMEGVYYPSPFDVISKLCDVVCYMIHFSKCDAVKNKLHVLLHNGIDWSEKFNVGEINLICKICHELN